MNYYFQGSWRFRLIRENGISHLKAFPPNEHNTITIFFVLVQREKCLIPTLSYEISNVRKVDFCEKYRVCASRYKLLFIIQIYLSLIIGMCTIHISRYIIDSIRRVMDCRTTRTVDFNAKFENENISVLQFILWITRIGNISSLFNFLSIQSNSQNFRLKM